MRLTCDPATCERRAASMPGMAVFLFAGIPVRDFTSALHWYERLFGTPPSSFPHDTEAVWELAEHRRSDTAPSPANELSASELPRHGLMVPSGSSRAWLVSQASIERARSWATSTTSRVSLASPLAFFAATASPSITMQ
jgi:hypothetical protein